MFVDLLYKYFVATFIVGTGFFIGFKIVDNFVYQPMIKENDEDAEYAGLSEEEISVKKYNKLYLEEYSNLEINDMNEHDLRKLQKCFLIEETPLGVVKMYYCYDNESFIYWSEKQVPYKVLETVSRKYVIDYDCKFIYVDMDYELNKREELMDKIDSTKAATDISGTDVSGNDVSGTDVSDSDSNSVFVTFKKYNSANSKESIQKETNNKTKGKKTENVIVCDKANRYSYRGVYNSDEDCKISSSNINNDIKKMSVQDFLNAKKKFSLEEKENSSSDGFWRFLDMKFIKNSKVDCECDWCESECESECESDSDSDCDCSEKIKTIIGGHYSINNEIFTSRDKYHKRVMEELTNQVKHNDNSSDNSFDLMECDIVKDEKREVLNLDSAVESGLTRRRSASFCEESVNDMKGLDDKKSNSWLW